MGKTTMSVTEMRRLLNLGKTDSYWLVHQGFFETTMVNGKIRVVIDSFEKWYSLQTKHRKVTGEEPGLLLHELSYSISEIAEMLGICKDQARYIVKQAGLRYFKVHSQYQIAKLDFNRWYATQSHYVKALDYESIKKGLISLPQMASRLGIHRNNVYSLLTTKANSDALDLVRIGDRTYVTKDSFFRWLDDHPEYKSSHKKRITHLLRKPKNPAYYTPGEVCRFYGVNQGDLYRKLNLGEIKAIHFGSHWRIERYAFDNMLLGKGEE